MAASVENQIKTVKDTVFAMQVVMSCVFEELGNSDDRIREAIKRGFDAAADGTERTAMKAGKTELGETSVTVLQIIEELRSVTVGKWDKAPRST